MSFSYFHTSPAHLPWAQQQAWNERRQMAENILTRQIDAVPNVETIVHLQRYVAGEITLGQAIGRLLDAQGRAH